MIKIDEATEVSTKTLCELAHFTQQRLQQLEKRGVVQRSGRDRWKLIATLGKLFDHARSRSTVSSERLRWERARAQISELKLAEQSGLLVNRHDLEQEFWEGGAAIIAEIDGIPAAFTRDLKERARLQALIDEARNRLADRFQRQAELQKKQRKVVKHETETQQTKGRTGGARRNRRATAARANSRVASDHPSDQGAETSSS